VNGIVLAGFGGGSFIFNQVQTAYINPQNLGPDQPTFPGSTTKYEGTHSSPALVIIS
jgi:hypothetical protein